MEVVVELGLLLLDIFDIKIRGNVTTRNLYYPPHKPIKKCFNDGSQKVKAKS